MALAPCPSCRRHVDVASQVCPFCRAACTGLVARTPPPGRFSRKALATVASAIVIAGCGADDRELATVDSGATDVGADTRSDTGGTTDSGSPSDSASDSGSDSVSDSGAMSDSESDVHDSGGALPPYGLPPSDGG